MSTNGTKKLFTPTHIGPTTLKHRIVMAPMTRQRSHWPSNVPSDLQVEYYTQRSSEGGLIIAEGTAVSHRGHGGKGSPGLWTKDQVSGWRRVTDAVHAKGGFIFAQLWHAGRLSHVSTSGETPVAPSVDPDFWINPASPANLVSTSDGLVPPSPHRALDVAEIPGVIDEYRIAAHNAKAAGFDGVELHSAYGYLLDEFLQDISNHRTDTATAARSKTASDCLPKSLRPPFQCGEPTVSRCASLRAIPSTPWVTVTRMRCSTMSLHGLTSTGWPTCT